MTTTNNNPGVVNVADQAFKPDLRVDSLAVPLDDDVLVPVADQEIAPVTGNPLATTFPTPAEAIVGEQAPGSPSQDFSQVPGVPPLYLPFPPSKADPNVQGQSVTAGNPAEFTVAGPDISIQTNATPATVEDYTITAVLDADTGGPPTTTTAQVNGSFTDVKPGATGFATFISPAPLLPGLAGASAISIVGSPAPYDGVNAIDNVISLAGSFSQAAINIATTGTTLGSDAILPVGLATAKWISISGSSVAAYNGIHVVSNPVSLAGGFDKVAKTDPIGAELIVVSTAPLPAALADGQLVKLAGAYSGWYTVDNIVSISGSFDTATSGGGNVTFHSVSALPASLANGQQVRITGTVNFDGTYEVINLNAGAHTFDIVHAPAATEHGNWAVWTFNITAAYVSSDVSTWAANTFDIDVVYAGTPAGTPPWTVYTFDIPYSGSVVTAAGTWQYNPAQVQQTTRYKLYVTPTSLTSFGISMLGRQIVFDDSILTVDNEGAARLITGYASNWIVIDPTPRTTLSRNWTTRRWGTRSRSTPSGRRARWSRQPRPRRWT